MTDRRRERGGGAEPADPGMVVQGVIYSTTAPNYIVIIRLIKLTNIWEELYSKLSSVGGEGGGGGKSSLL